MLTQAQAQALATLPADAHDPTDVEPRSEPLSPAELEEFFSAQELRYGTQ